MVNNCFEYIKFEMPIRYENGDFKLTVRNLEFRGDIRFGDANLGVIGI